MGMTLNVARAAESLSIGALWRLLQGMRIADQFSVATTPHNLYRQVAKYVVANKLTDEFFAAYDAIRGAS